MTFLGTPIRLYAEGWDEDLLEDRTRTAVRMCKDAGLTNTFVTEDTVRSHPGTLRRLFTAAVEEGVDGLCVCDTVGHATPNGVYNLVHFTKDLIRGLGTDMDWHGHNDRVGLGNALSAIEAGGSCPRNRAGYGERVETPLDLMLMNLTPRYPQGTFSLADRSIWPQVVRLAHPDQHPVFGKDAFRTGTGVHAAAVIKALNKGDDW